jgi:hypothetical protein
VTGEPAEARRNPCPSCPYRRDVPSGIWHEDEYAILPDFDGDPASQAVSGHGTGIFRCHQADGKICSGWAGHRDPHDLLALRLGVSLGTVSPAVLEYRTDVPLFASGAEAAAHGLRDYEKPSPRAVRTAGKIIRVRERRGSPVGTGEPKAAAAVRKEAAGLHQASAAAAAVMLPARSSAA